MTNDLVSACIHVFKQEILASYMFPHAWPVEFVSEEGQKLHMMLYYALLNMIHLKAILHFVQSSDFASLLVQHYWGMTDDHVEDGELLITTRNVFYRLFGNSMK